MLANLMACSADLLKDAWRANDSNDLARVWRNVKSMIDALITDDETAIRAEFRGGSTPYFLGNKMEDLDQLSNGGINFILFIDKEDNTPEPTSQRILIHSKDISW